MKRLFLYFLLISWFAIVASCSATIEPRDEPSSEASDEVSVFRDVERGEVESGLMMQQRANLGYEELIDLASHVFKGTFVKYTEQEENGSYELVFEVGDIFKGDRQDEEAYVHIIPYNWTGDKYEEYNFIEGHEYLLITERHNMPSLDHDRYYPLGNIFIPLTDEIEAHIDYRPINGGDVPLSALSQRADQQVANESLMLYTTELCKNSPTPPPVEIPFIRSEDLSEILPETEFVLLITAKNQWRKWSRIREGSGIYDCSVDEVISGDYSVPDEIIIPFISDEIVSGHSYYVLLNRAAGANSMSRMFSESSPNSLFDADDAGAVEELMSYLELS